MCRGGRALSCPRDERPTRAIAIVEPRRRRLSSSSAWGACLSRARRGSWWERAAAADGLTYSEAGHVPGACPWGHGRLKTFQQALIDAVVRLGRLSPHRGQTPVVFLERDNPAPHGLSDNQGRPPSGTRQGSRPPHGPGGQDPQVMSEKALRLAEVRSFADLARSSSAPRPLGSASTMRAGSRARSRDWRRRRAPSGRSCLDEEESDGSPARLILLDDVEDSARRRSARARATGSSSSNSFRAARPINCGGPIAHILLLAAGTSSPAFCVRRFVKAAGTARRRDPIVSLDLAAVPCAGTRPHLEVSSITPSCAERGGRAPPEETARSPPPLTISCAWNRRDGRGPFGKRMFAPGVGPGFSPLIERSVVDLPAAVSHTEQGHDLGPVGAPRARSPLRRRGIDP